MPWDPSPSLKQSMLFSFPQTEGNAFATCSQRPRSSTL